MNQLLYEQYKQQRKWNSIINVSSILGVLIACIGLFGLSGIDSANRTKEIGIRKVLGANLSSILMILNKKTLLLIVAAIVIAIPVSFYVMQAWLENFAYKVSLKGDIFLISGLLCLLVVLLTSAYHSIKTAHVNPSQLLRDQ
jgi:putative ABC transport system permease protein